MYIARAIILSRDIIRDKQIRTILFTREYGKISAWEKKISHGDIGSLIEVKIERRGRENIILQATVIHTPDISFWNYATTLEYLFLLHILRELLAYGSEQSGLFDDISALIDHTSSQKTYGETTSISMVQLFILVQTRSLKILGILIDTYYDTPLLTTIYNRLDTVSMKSITLSKVLCTHTESTLKKSVLASIHPYLTRSSWL